MKIEITVTHYHHHHQHSGRDNARILQAINQLREGIETMSGRLQASIAALVAQDAVLKSDLDELLTIAQNEKQAITDAVAKALADAGVSDDAAADAIDQVDAALAAHDDAVKAVLAAAATGGATGATGGTGSGATGDTGATGGATGATGNDGSALSFVSFALMSGVVGAAYSDIVVAAGGVAPLTFTSMPDSQNGIIVNPDGSVTGTPKTAETDTFAVAVIDASGASASGIFTIVVDDSSAQA